MYNHITLRSKHQNRFDFVTAEIKKIGIHLDFWKMTLTWWRPSGIKKRPQRGFYGLYGIRLGGCPGIIPENKSAFCNFISCSYVFFTNALHLPCFVFYLKHVLTYEQVRWRYVLVYFFITFTTQQLNYFCINHDSMEINDFEILLINATFYVQRVWKVIYF